LPSGYAQLQDFPGALVKYDFEWICKGDTDTREMPYDVGWKGFPLSASHDAYLFIRFGPVLEPQKGKVIRAESLSAVLTGTTSASHPITVMVPLQLAYDDPGSGVGPYYWGPLNVANSYCPEGKTCLTLNVSGRDSVAHLKARLEATGEELDSKPETVAKVVVSAEQGYPFSDYEPGTDTNHSMLFGPAVVPDEFEPNNTPETAYVIRLSDFEQKRLVATLMPPNDVDFFKVDWRSVGQGGEYSIDTPEFQFVQEHDTVGVLVNDMQFGSSLSFTVYRTNGQIYQSDPPYDAHTLLAHTREFADGQLIFQVGNADWTQGPARYDINVGLAITRLIPHELDVVRDFLHLPYTPLRVIHGGEIVYPAPELALSDMESCIPLILGALPAPDRLRREASLRFSVGRYAQVIGAYSKAEQMYTDSARCARTANDRRLQVSALTTLRGLYEQLGMTAQAQGVETELHAIT
jgi:hypothetical protein